MTLWGNLERSKIHERQNLQRTESEKHANNSVATSVFFLDGLLRWTDSFSRIEDLRWCGS